MQKITDEDVAALAAEGSDRAEALLTQLRADADDLAAACPDVLDPARQAEGLRLLAEAIAAVQAVRDELDNPRS